MRFQNTKTKPIFSNMSSKSVNNQEVDKTSQLSNKKKNIHLPQFTSSHTDLAMGAMPTTADQQIKQEELLHNILGIAKD
jgi:hypothetical protein